MARVLIFGATGMVGSGVLRACLNAATVESVTAILRRAPATTHPKLRVVASSDFLNLPTEAFQGIDLCLFCLGISASQVSGEPEYRRITYEYPMEAARLLREQSPAAAFHYISGEGAALDSRYMWARVKAEAERDLIANYGALCLRPAAVGGKPGERTAIWIRAIAPVMRLFRGVRSLYVDSEDIGKAMLTAYREILGGRILRNAEIRDLADRA